MKRNKIIVAVIALALVAVAVFATACDTTEDTRIKDALKLASQGDYLKVEVSDDAGLFYVYDNGKVTDSYGLGIKFEDVVTEKGEAFAFTEENLKEGYVCETDETTGKISLSAELVNTDSLGIDGAKLLLEANTVEKEVTTYVITYTDENGYKVRITLA